MVNLVENISRLEQSLHCSWPHLRDAKLRAETKRRELRDVLTGLDSEDTSIVVSGSLARDEFTDGSDIDWTLLIDGLADPKHHDLSRKIRILVDACGLKKPGVEGTFGAMVFSHDLIHQIGGEDDTNQNTTRRLLLLLESKVVGREDAYERVIKHVLSRYLLEDRGLWRSSKYRVPRFLQNDVARYWRTMAVDFAYKLRNRSGKGWAIRNLKLRMSRKLIYVSGLLACFRCHLDHSDPQGAELFRDPSRRKEVVEYLRQILAATPLEIVASVLLRYPHLADATRDIFESYDQFLGILADNVKREHLELLTEESGDSDEVYQYARGLTHRFRDGLLAFFFDQQGEMDDLTKNYGVF